MYREIFDFASLASHISELVGPHGFLPLGPFGERHGSWHQTFHKHLNGLDLFLIVALTDLPPTGEYEIEIYVSAQDGTRSCHREVATFRGREEKFYTESWRGSFRESLEHAANLADRTLRLELNESFCTEPTATVSAPAGAY